MPFRAEGGCADKHQEKLLRFLSIQSVVIGACGTPPLCHCVTSPPQGWRLGARLKQP